jgi:hypothetical protein
MRMSFPALEGRLSLGGPADNGANAKSRSSISGHASAENEAA